MFPTSLDSYHTRAAELSRQAEEFRLLKSQRSIQEWAFGFFESLGLILIALGEQLITSKQSIQ